MTELQRKWRLPELFPHRDPDNPEFPAGCSQQDDHQHGGSEQAAREVRAFQPPLHNVRGGCGPLSFCIVSLL